MRNGSRPPWPPFALPDRQQAGGTTLTDKENRLIEVLAQGWDLAPVEVNARQRHAPSPLAVDPFPTSATASHHWHHGVLFVDRSRSISFCVT